MSLESPGPEHSHQLTAAAPQTRRGRYLAFLALAVILELRLAQALAGVSFVRWLIDIFVAAAALALVLSAVGIVYGKARQTRPTLASKRRQEQVLLVIASGLLLVALAFGIWVTPPRGQDVGWLIFPWLLAATSVVIQLVSQPVGKAAPPPETPLEPHVAEPVAH